MRRVLIAITALLVPSAIFIGSQAPGWAADALLHPMRRPLTDAPPEHCQETAFAGDGLTLRGWRCRAGRTPRATIVYLHGIADNRASARGVIARFLPRGFDVVAYDSRANGQSDGTTCTYGYYEKQDLKRVIDAIDGGRVVLIGMSLGAAVALQEAADDPRVEVIVSADTFSDLRTVARERAPGIMPDWSIRSAFTIAEERGRFHVDDVSPVAAAARITAPVLVLHGADDRDTPPEHSQRVFEALRGAKRIIFVKGAHHSQSLRDDTWPAVDAWLDEALGSPNHI